MSRAILAAALFFVHTFAYGEETGGEAKREEVVKKVNETLKDAAKQASKIKSKVEEYVKKKELPGDKKDEEGAKKELDEAIAAAKKLKDIAKEMQALSNEANSLPPATDEEIKRLLDKYKKIIGDLTSELKLAQRDLQLAVAEASKKFEEPLRPLMMALDDADGEFAAIVRKK